MENLQNQAQVVHRAVNACITPVCAMDGCHVVTVEGIGNTKKGLHPVQKELSDRFVLRKDAFPGAVFGVEIVDESSLIMYQPIL